MADDRDDQPRAEIVDLEPGTGDGQTIAGLPPRGPDRTYGLASPPGASPRVRSGDGRQIVCEGLVRIYKVADLEVVALQGLDLVVGVGEMNAIVGAPGSRKA